MKDLIAFSIPDANGTPVQVQAPPGIPTHIPFGTLIGNLLSAAIAIGIILALIYLVYGGLFWIQSKGNKEQLDKARRIIIYAIVGMIIMSFSLVIVNVIASAVGVKTLISSPAPPAP